jgi:Fe-S oxidoreductase
MRVIYFPGCADLLWPRLWKPTFRLFESFGIRAIVPRGLYCCGYPFLEAGDLQLARGLANENIKAVEKLDVDAMVVGCSTGKRVLDRYYRGILGFTGFPMEVYGLGDFLAQQVALPPPQTPVPAKVCYLAPRGIGRAAGAVTELLQKIPDMELVLLSDDQGCGESLFFATVHPELHEKIMRRVVESMVDLGCQIAVTESPHLMVLLAQYLRSREAAVGVMHLAELLALAWSLGDASWSGFFGEVDAGENSV